MARKIKAGDKFIDQNGVTWVVCGPSKFGRHTCRTEKEPIQMSDVRASVIQRKMEEQNG